MNRLINLEYYRIFCEVAQAGSITAAAGRLCISQPAVSQTIRQLEDGLGSMLFVRAQKGVRLTAEGEVLYSFVKKGMVQIRAGEEAFRSMIDLEQGEIRIGASDMTLRFYLLPYLERFHRQYPKIKVKVTNGPTPETLRFLREGRIDFGIVSSPFDSGQFRVFPVRKAEDCVIAGRQFAHYRDRVLPLSELERLPVICLEQNTSTRAGTDAWLKQNGVVLCPEFELATSDMIVQFVRRNLGVGLIVKDFAAEYVESKELFYLRFERPFPQREFCIASSEKHIMSRAARALLHILGQEEASERPESRTEEKGLVQSAKK